MNILGIDYGEARTGLAWASEEVKLALPLEVVPSKDTKKLLGRIAQVVDERQVDLVIVGLPLNLSSQDSLQTGKVRDFVESLRELVSVSVEVADERFTSQLASRYLEKGQSVDVESARILVEEWLDKHK
jgi:putative Holliday junction resolvase